MKLCKVIFFIDISDEKQLFKYVTNISTTFTAKAQINRSIKLIIIFLCEKFE